MHGQETENNMLANDVLTPYCTDEQTEAQRGQLTCSWCSLKRELIIIVPARGSGRGWGRRAVSAPCVWLCRNVFFVKELIKQQLIPTAVINRANIQAFGL